jgi:hypothetical protein
MSVPDEASTSAPPSIWAIIKRSRFFRISALVVAVLVSIHVLLLVDWHWDQDNCSFGPVSNERYRQLLSEAKARQAKDWPPLVRDYYKASMAVENRMRDLSREMTSVYERIAAMHAIMRAMGANYLNAGFPEARPFERAAQIGNGAGVAFEYRIDINRLGFFLPVLREVGMVARLSAGPSSSQGFPLPNSDSRGEFAFRVHFPSLLENTVIIPRDQTCPLVPPLQLAPAFSP